MHNIPFTVPRYISPYVRAYWGWIVIAYLALLAVLSIRYFILMRRLGNPIPRIVFDIVLFSIWWPPYLWTVSRPNGGARRR